LINDSQLVSAAVVTKLASKLDFVVAVTTVLTAEGGEDDLLEHGDLGVHESRLTVLLALHAEGLDDVAGHARIKVDKDLGKILVWLELVDGLGLFRLLTLLFLFRGCGSSSSNWLRG